MYFCIPSLSRFNTINGHTIDFLIRNGVKHTDIYVFVIAGEYEDYRVILNHNINVVLTTRGIRNARASISNHFGKNAEIITLDDDIRNVKMLDYNRLKPIDNFISLCESSFDIMKSKNISMCGFYPIDNPFFMKNSISYGLKFCVGALRLFINNPEIENSRGYKLLEDYETTVKYYIQDGAVMRYENICVIHNFGTQQGGLNETCERGYNAKYTEVMRFMNEYGKYCNKSNDRLTQKGRKIDLRLKNLGIV
jgi:hypothetical protein